MHGSSLEAITNFPVGLFTEIFHTNFSRLRAGTRLERAGEADSEPQSRAPALAFGLDFWAFAALRVVKGRLRRLSLYPGRRTSTAATISCLLPCVPPCAAQPASHCTPPCWVVAGGTAALPRLSNCTPSAPSTDGLLYSTRIAHVHVSLPVHRQKESSRAHLGRRL